jgi:hypothetical protein
MPKNTEGAAIRKAIRRLAGDPSCVFPTRQAKSDLMAWNLTTNDVCEAIRQWIDAGDPLQEVITTHAKGHVGKPAYVMKPRLCKSIWYVKLSVIQQDEERLLIISAHPSH